MLTRIGRKREPEGWVESLLECHERIRDFVGLARRLADTPGATTAEVRDVAGRVRGYFTDAMPLHMRDEEESLLPRLVGRDPVLDRALADMEREHGTHEAHVARLVELCGMLVAAPERFDELAAALSEAAARLERELLAHLELEERVIFPAIRDGLDAAVQQVISRELRSRRTGGPR